MTSNAQLHDVMQSQRRSQQVLRNGHVYSHRRVSNGSENATSSRDAGRYVTAIERDRFSVNNNNNVGSGSQLPHSGSRSDRFVQPESNGNKADVIAAFRQRRPSSFEDRHDVIGATQGEGHQHAHVMNRSRSELSFKLPNDLDTPANDRQMTTERNDVTRAMRPSMLNGLRPHPTTNSEQSPSSLLPSRPQPQHVIHDGYATLTRAMRERMKSARHSDVTGSKQARDVTSRTVILSQEPLTSPVEFETRILRMLQQRNDPAASMTSRRTGNDGIDLAATVHGLPQHDIEVHRARSVFLRRPSLSDSPHSLAPSSSDAASSSSPVNSPSLDETSPDTRVDTRTPFFSFMTSRLGSLRRSKKRKDEKDSASDSSKKRDSVDVNRLEIATQNMNIAGDASEHEMSEKARMLRSNSTPNIAELSGLSAVEQSDDEHDDYGFLSFRSFRAKDVCDVTTNDTCPLPVDVTSPSNSEAAGATTSDVMTRTKSQFLPKKWRKPKSTSTVKTQWQPQVRHMFCNIRSLSKSRVFDQKYNTWGVWKQCFCHVVTF